MARRQAVKGWIENYTQTILLNMRAGSRRAHAAAWRQAVEAWLLEHDFFEVLQPKSVTPFSMQMISNDGWPHNSSYEIQLKTAVERAECFPPNQEKKICGMKTTEINMLQIILVVSLLCAGCSTAKTNTFTYQNPIASKAIPAIRDPQIIPHEGAYYLIGTAPPFWGPKTVTALPPES